MLILTRKVGETVVIGDEVEVTIMAIKGNQVRVGVKAPRDMTVHREEVYEQLRAGGLAAGGGEKGGGGDAGEDGDA